MGAKSKPPLPAPTDTSAISSGDNGSVLPDDLATDISRATEKTSYSIPEDGSPVTITTTKKSPREGLTHQRQQSQTSLLIEYFEGGKSSDSKVHQRPSVRVRVTPSSAKKNRSDAHDHIQITETGKNRKPAYTRRISLGGAGHDQDNFLPAGTELSFTDESTLSALPPVEVEVLQHDSDLSSRGGRYVAPPSDISSMPPDSMLEMGAPSTPARRRRSRSLEKEEIAAAMLKTPSRRRSRSLSRERVAAQKAMEKIRSQEKESVKQKRVSTREEGAGRERTKESRSSRSRAEPESLQPSEISRLSDHRSVRSGTSVASSLNNPKLLQTVEDAIRRLILPELNALKEEQRTQKNRVKYESSTRDRDSYASTGSRSVLERSLSKSSSEPHFRGKPHLVFTKDGDNYERDHSAGKLKKIRRSSRGSEHGSERRTSAETVTREKAHRKSSSEGRALREAAAAAGVATLTAAALRQHNSLTSFDDADEKKERRRKRRSKSRSRTASISETQTEGRLGEERPTVPPLPFRSEVQSELTRDSILSADTERPPTGSSRDHSTPIREIQEVQRGSPRQLYSPTPVTPTRSPMSYKRGLGTFHENSPSGNSVHSGRSAHIETVERGLAPESEDVTPVHEVNQEDILSHHEYTEHMPRQLSPIQSVASYELGDDYDDNSAYHQVEAIRGTALTPGRTSNRKVLERDLHVSTPARSDDILEDETPRAAEVDEWLDQNHKKNELYRHSDYDDGSSIDHKRDTLETNISDFDSPNLAHAVKFVSATPGYVRTPLAVESAVASLHGPSSISVKSSHSSHFGKLPKVQERTVDETYLDRPRSFARDGFMGISATDSPAGAQWGQLPPKLRTPSNKSVLERDVAPSPQQSAADSTDIRFSSTAIPNPHIPEPEPGYYERDESEINTNPTPIKGPIGQRKDRVLDDYDITPRHSRDHLDDSQLQHEELVSGEYDQGKPSSEFETNARYQPRASEVSDDYDHEVINRSPGLGEAQGRLDRQITSPTRHDEGYDTGPVGETPEPRYTLPRVMPKLFDEADLETFNPADYAKAGGAVAGVEDPFRPARHVRAMSGTSHGMASPLYDSATGKGLDRIQSRDIVALMDHLTVRDAQRNARDTEILVTLVRSATEMRNSFEEMKRFITEQDKMIMANTDRDAEHVVQRVLGGPRPQPTASPRTTPRRGSSDDVEDNTTRRKNILKRALKGWSMKSSNDLTNIEGMIMRLLDEVEGLKGSQGFRPMQQTESPSLNSYENLRAAPESGYETGGRAGTSPSPDQSGYQSNSSSRHTGMHSGYDGRRGSEHRISTVIEGDEESERGLGGVEHQYGDTERLTTPTQEVRRGNHTGGAVHVSPPEQSGSLSQSAEQTPKTGERKSKHKSTASSLFGMVPRVSRWSKTTASTVPESGRDSQEHPRSANEPYGSASRSGSNVNLTYYPDGGYLVHEDDRLRSATSLHNPETASARGGNVRSPSPLIPSEVDMMEEDDPKYQAHRNSLNLQHPQPRPGPTQRHQNQLESQALYYDPRPAVSPISGLSDNDHDQWGSNPSLALNRARVPAMAATPLSPVYSDRSYNHQHQRGGPPIPPKIADDGPLVPPKIPVDYRDDTQDALLAYGSPMNSGYLKPLEPIQEVRRSMETDRLHTPSPASHARSSMHSTQRKITGPREMPSRSPSGSKEMGRGQEDPGAVRRKPVARSLRSLDSYHDTESNVSETF